MKFKKEIYHYLNGISNSNLLTLIIIKNLSFYTKYINFK